MVNQGKNILFSLDIRVSGQEMSIPVYEGENHESLVKRFCEQHTFKEHYKQAIKDKIIESLIGTLKKIDTSNNLKTKLNSFLQGRKEEERDESKEKIERRDTDEREKIISDSASKIHSAISTPFRLIPQTHTITQSSFKEKPSSLLSNQSSKYKNNQDIRENRYRSRGSVGGGNIVKTKVGVGKIIDRDLISAYETILKKSKDPAMKNVAKKMLEQSGYFKNKPITHQSKEHNNHSSFISNKFTDSEPNKTLHVEFEGIHLGKETIESKNKSETNSFTNVELIDPFEYSQSPNKESTEQRKSKSPKKQRIKYDIGEATSKENEYFNAKVYTESSAYMGNRSPYWNKEKPESFEKYPAYEETISYENKCYGEPERENSLGKTRKYKYL